MKVIFKSGHFVIIEAVMYHIFVTASDIPSWHFWKYIDRCPVKNSSRTQYIFDISLVYPISYSIFKKRKDSLDKNKYDAGILIIFNLL